MMGFVGKAEPYLKSYCQFLYPIDRYFAELICDLAGDKASNDLFIAASLTSYLTSGQRQICLDLNEIQRYSSLAEFFESRDSVQNFQKENYELLRQIQIPKQWGEKLVQSGVVAPVKNDEFPYEPLILDANRLYLQRYWNYEQNLAKMINKKYHYTSDHYPFILDCEDLQREIPNASILFQQNQRNNWCRPDWQQTAVYVALSSPLSIITGGSGTGKTTVVSVILSLLLQYRPNVKVALCAPTGKAQSRLKEALRLEQSNLFCSDMVKEKMKDVQVGTIHRLLGYQPDTSYFLRNASKPLNIDYLVVDEASMISLPLMAKLMEAVPDQAGVLLIGDKDQLASVESGAVLADLCTFAQLGQQSDDLFSIQYKSYKSFPSSTPKDLSESIVALTKSHRFQEKMGIGRFKELIKIGDVDACLALVTRDTTGEIVYNSLPAGDRLEYELADFLNNWKIKQEKENIYFWDFLKPVRRESDFDLEYVLDKAFGVYDRFRILCPHRRGLMGAENINWLVRSILGKTRTYSKGIPLMVTANDYTLKLFNGDIGLCWYDNDGILKVFFPNSEYYKNDTSFNYRKFLPSQLPKHETVFAMTVHKAQGSGFDNILMLFPERDSQILTRELVYTGITRAKNKVSLWANLSILSSAIKRQTKRSSGLVDALIRYR